MRDEKIQRVYLKGIYFDFNYFSGIHHVCDFGYYSSKNLYRMR